MILEPGGVDGVGAELPCTDPVVLAPDHPTEAWKIALGLVRMGVWRDNFLDDGSASLKSRPRDARDATIDRLRTKVGELTLDTELLQAKIARLEAGGGPFAARRSKR